MIKTTLGAQRYNNRMDKIFNRARQERAFIKATLTDTTDDEVMERLLADGYSYQTAKHYVQKRSYYLTNY